MSYLIKPIPCNKCGMIMCDDCSEVLQAIDEDDWNISHIAQHIKGLQTELEKYKPIKIDLNDESTWPPVREWFLDYDAGCWEDDFFEDEEDRQKQINKHSYWILMPPAPEEN